MERTTLLLLFLTLVVACNGAPRKMVGIYELKKDDFTVKLTNWGATIMSVVLPDCNGTLSDVVLGYDGLAPYVKNEENFGALIGRVTGIISNGRFVLNGTAHRLYRNLGNNTLHGGGRGFSHALWSVAEYSAECEKPYITFYYHSFDGEQGFPGALDVFVTYTISGDYELSVRMHATALNKATPVNLASHGYWNLAGHDSGDVLSNTLQIFATHYTPVDDDLVPSGAISPVAGTPYDFRQPRAIGSRIHEVPEGGYNNNYVLDSPVNEEGMRVAAVVKDPKSGRGLEVWTNQPAMVLYTSYYLENVSGKGGHVYGRYDAVSLETEGFPDAVNQPGFPSQVVNPGEVYKHYMIHKFSF